MTNNHLRKQLVSNNTSNTKIPSHSLINRLRTCEKFSNNQISGEAAFRLSTVGYYERLAPGIVRIKNILNCTVFREGDLANCWYVLLSGQLSLVYLDAFGKEKSCDADDILAEGSIFGESVACVVPHSCTAFVKSTTELLRVEHRVFKDIYASHGGELNAAVCILNSIFKKKPIKGQTLPQHHNLPPNFAGPESDYQNAHENMPPLGRQLAAQNWSAVPSDNCTQGWPPPFLHVTDARLRQPLSTEKGMGARPSFSPLFENLLHQPGQPTFPQLNPQHQLPPNHPAEPAAMLLGQNGLHGHIELMGMPHEVYSSPSRLDDCLNGGVDGHVEQPVADHVDDNRLYESSQVLCSSVEDAGYMSDSVIHNMDAAVRQPTAGRSAPAQQKCTSEQGLGMSPFVGFTIFFFTAKPNAFKTQTRRGELRQHGRTVRRAMLLHSPNLIRDRRYHGAQYASCMVGAEMVDWLLALRRRYDEMADNPKSVSRLNAVGVWQALLEVGSIHHVSEGFPFMDKYIFYRWLDDGIDKEEQQYTNSECDNGDATKQTSTTNFTSELSEALQHLSTVGPDALFRVLLTKAPYERSSEEVQIIYDELVHVKALSHLSTSVKRQLAGVIYFEAHAHAGTVLFHQGEEGKSWYIILKGSVNVCIHGKGVVCTLFDGDDFGKLALVNDVPRAASIVLRQDDCHFLRVDKHDFNRILRDVEENMVCLREYNKDVLVLERIALRESYLTLDGRRKTAPTQSYKYSIMAGTPNKMLEYLLETRMDIECTEEKFRDTFVEDFILTHQIFLTSTELCNALKSYYQSALCTPKAMRAAAVNHEPLINLMSTQDGDNMFACKRRVIQFVQKWTSKASIAFFQDPVGPAFIEELYSAVLEDSRTSMGHMGKLIADVEALMTLRDKMMSKCARQQQLIFDCGQYQVAAMFLDTLLPCDQVILVVHLYDPLYHPSPCCEVQVRLDASVGLIKRKALEQLAGTVPECDNLFLQKMHLVLVKSSGDKVLFDDNQTNVATTVGPNDCLFVTHIDYRDQLTPHALQEGPREGLHSCTTLRLLTADEIAYQLAALHWRMTNATHEMELVYLVLGRCRFPGRTPAALDTLMRRFEEVRCWVITEVLLCANLQLRANVAKKFVKIAAESKKLHDLLSFFAIVLALKNCAISRLQATWDRVPNKVCKQLASFEALLDPTRNHRSYRLLVEKMQPPIIPFVPLLLKDLTFIHDGNKTLYDGLVNFEKMHMIADVLRNWRRFKSRTMCLQDQRYSTDAQELIRNFQVIDDQRKMMRLSIALEPFVKKR